MLRTEVITLIILRSPVTWNKYQTDTTLENFFLHIIGFTTLLLHALQKGGRVRKNASYVKNLDTEGSFFICIAYPSHSDVPDEAGIS